jgi:hypothetical protein
VLLQGKRDREREKEREREMVRVKEREREPFTVYTGLLLRAQYASD